MAAVAFVGSTISGTTTSDHCYWEESYSCNCGLNGCSTCYTDHYTSAPVTGTINGGSSNVFINGNAAANDSSTTSEQVSCPSPYSGVSSGTGDVVSSSTVFVNGIPIAHNGDSVTHFSGNGTVTSGSSTVFAS